jgi:hypothetical protein
MSDDVCGHPTAGGDGPPCQHPTTDDGDPDRCWEQAHNDSETDAGASGREWAIDDEDHDDILEAARDGFSKAGCARAAGVDEKSLQRYLDADGHEEFRRAFMRARHKGEQTLVKGPLVEHPDAPGGGPEIDGQHARFLLSTSFDYQKTEKKELEDVTEGSDGFGTTVVLDSEYVDDE